MKTSGKSKNKNFNSNSIKIMASVVSKDLLLHHKYLPKKIFNLKILVKKQHFKTDTQIHLLKMKTI